MKSGSSNLEPSQVEELIAKLYDFKSNRINSQVGLKFEQWFINNPNLKDLDLNRIVNGIPLSISLLQYSTAVKHNHYLFRAMLEAEGINWNAKITQGASQGLTPLHIFMFAIGMPKRKDALSVISNLVNLPNLDWNAQISGTGEDNGITPLHLFLKAIITNNDNDQIISNLSQVLMQPSLDFTIPIKSGEFEGTTPLHLLLHASLARVEVLNILPALAKRNLNWNVKNKAGITPLHQLVNLAVNDEPKALEALHIAAEHSNLDWDAKCTAEEFLNETPRNILLNLDEKIANEILNKKIKPNNSSASTTTTTIINTTNTILNKNADESLRTQIRRKTLLKAFAIAFIVLSIFTVCSGSIMLSLAAPLLKAGISISAYQLPVQLTLAISTLFMFTMTSILACKLYWTSKRKTQEAEKLNVDKTPNELISDIIEDLNDIVIDKAFMNDLNAFDPSKILAAPNVDEAKVGVFKQFRLKVCKEINEAVLDDIRLERQTKALEEARRLFGPQK
ncbi:MAG: hypothetical protein JSS07_12365 [Proteobacteria bacterium]|nr:hypothetical protein [Pseudomonadota bacterium]